MSIENTTPAIIAEVKTTLLEMRVGEEIAPYIGLQVVGIDDHEGFKQMDDARKALKRIRLDVAKTEAKFLELAKAKFDEAKEELDNAKQVFEQKKQEFEVFKLQISEVASTIAEPAITAEKQYQDRLNEIKQLRKEAAEAEERKRLEMIKERTDKLFEIGCAFNGEYYHIGNLKIAPARIETAESVEWLNICEKLKAEADRLAEEERKREEEAEKARKLAEENEKLKAEIEALRAKAIPPPVETVPPVETAPAVDTPPTPPKPQTPPPPPAKETQTPQHIPTETPPAAKLTPSEQAVIDLVGSLPQVNAVHFKGGFHKGVAWTKDQVIALVDSAKNRGELKSKINAL